MRIIVVLVKLVFFVMSKVSEWNRVAIKFCVKLKETVTEAFEMLRSLLVEECLFSTSVFEWHDMFKEGYRK
jgi:hypothetical protein